MVGNSWLDSRASLKSIPFRLVFDVCSLSVRAFPFLAKSEISFRGISRKTDDACGSDIEEPAKSLRWLQWRSGRTSAGIANFFVEGSIRNKGAAEDVHFPIGPKSGAALSLQQHY